MIRSKNYSKVFKVFKKNYVLVPLEVFGKNRFKTLISTILSARTKDENTLISSQKLFERADNLEKLKKLEVKEIEKLIYPVGFYKTKARNLFKLARQIDNIPDTLEKLIKLPGVGRKTANLVLNRAFNKPAIAVDTHVHKISNLLGWVKTKKPEETEKELNKILPKKYWSSINKLFVSIGRQYTTIKRLKEFLKKNNLIQNNF